ncbi:glycerol-3-phosphate acyltransferase [Bacillus sp. FSL K6-3431]|uniref:glycerol-3-phosphate acyltransferase n=1 Tax=Bacillus sp. FSL K6-3431 TaxID=2921500 RepID=UPI0030F87A30
MKEILLLIGAYVFGNILTGYILAKNLYRKDIYQEGSGNAGARNAGRIFGKWAFVFTFFGDAGKGALVVLVARWLGFTMEWQLLILLAVIIGHIFPVFLHFHGGKGMSTYIGGMLAFHPLLFTAFAGAFILFYVIFKSVTLAGMAAILIFPVIMIPFTFEWSSILIACTISALVLFAHRQNIIEKIFSERKIS